MTYVREAFKAYNANSQDIDRNDCVARAMSLAFNQDYSVLLNKLRKFARDNGYAKHNLVSCFDRYIKNTFGVTHEDLHGSKTVDEFCKEHPNGTYLLLCGKSRLAEHMTCVMKGDIYDTWDCSKYKVGLWYTVSDAGDDLDSIDMDILSAIDAFSEIVDNLLKGVQRKMPYVTFEFKIDDQTKFSFRGRLRMTFEDTGFQAYDGDYVEKYFVVKFNPRQDMEPQMKSTFERVRVAIREWLYGYRKDIEDLKREKSIKPNPEFYGDNRLLSKLPAEFIPYVTDAEDTGPESENRWSAYRYRIFFYDFKGDNSSRTDYLEAETLTELRKLISTYLKTGEIIHY